MDYFNNKDKYIEKYLKNIDKANEISNDIDENDLNKFKEKIN